MPDELCWGGNILVSALYVFGSIRLIIAVSTTIDNVTVIINLFHLRSTIRESNRLSPSCSCFVWFSSKALSPLKRDNEDAGGDGDLVQDLRYVLDVAHPGDSFDLLGDYEGVT